MSPQSWQRVGSPRQAPSNVLVLGASGMVGRAWVERLQQLGIRHTALRRPEFDLSIPSTIKDHVRCDYDLVVNAAAWTDVDGAETDEQGANQANAFAVDAIAKRCAAMDATLITYSTDYVFDGDAKSPYPIDAPIAPMNAYGRSKALGESLLRAATENHLLIRTSWVYAPWGKNFVITMRNLMQSRDTLSVVNDQQGRPTSAQGLAANSLELYLNGACGTWHATDSGACTWHEFAQEIGAIEQSGCTAWPCASSEFPRPAKRPAYSILDIAATVKLIGPIDAWQSQLRDALGQIDS